MATKKGKHKNRSKKTTCAIAKKPQTQRLARGTGEQPRLSQTGFTEIEESFFAAGAELCAQHAAAPIVMIEAASEPRPSWWRRLWTRTPASVLAFD